VSTLNFHMSTVEKNATISRKEAAALLNLSIRTVDRYVHSGKLSTVEESGRKWLYKNEIGDLLRVDKVDRVDTPKKVDMSIDNVDKTVDRGVDKVDIMSTKNTRPRPATETYKKLFQELQEELKEKQERLEVANYRVGQLENQVRNSIPLLQYHQEKQLLLDEEEKASLQIQKAEDNINKLKYKVNYLRYSKRLFIFFFFVLLALQPLWLLLYFQ
jgi:excisionase family DNA binding protein